MKKKNSEEQDPKVLEKLERDRERAKTVLGTIETKGVIRAYSEVMGYINRFWHRGLMVFAIFGGIVSLIMFSASFFKGSPYLSFAWVLTGIYFVLFVAELFAIIVTNKIDHFCKTKLDEELDLSLEKLKTKQKGE